MGPDRLRFWLDLDSLNISRGFCCRVAIKLAKICQGSKIAVREVVAILRVYSILWAAEMRSFTICACMFSN